MSNYPDSFSGHPLPGDLNLGYDPYTERRRKQLEKAEIARIRFEAAQVIRCAECLRISAELNELDTEAGDHEQRNLGKCQACELGFIGLHCKRCDACGIETTWQGEQENDNSTT